MPDPIDPKDVNPTENPSPVEPQEPVNDNTGTPPAEDATTQEQGESQAQEITEPVANEAVDASGIPWKNRAIEAERKSTDIIPQIRQIVEELTVKQQPKKEEYTRDHIPQLRQYAKDNPQYADWVEQQVSDIHVREVRNVVKQELGEMKQAQTNEVTRQQSEQWVINHPKFKDCFVDVNGAKQWNYQNPLTTIIGKYLNQVDPVTNKPVKDRPDGLMVAARMAYADHALNAEPTMTAKTNQLKKDLRKTQKTQITPGGGAPVPKTPRSAVKDSMADYGKTLNQKSVHSAVKAYLVADGKLKED